MDNNEEQNNELICGRNTVLAYLKQLDERQSDDQGPELASVNRIYMETQQTKDDPRLHQIKSLAKKEGIVVMDVPRFKLDSMVGRETRHQGVVASLSPTKLKTQSDLFDMVKHLEGNAMIVACDGIEDPRNLGAIVRAAEAIGACGVVVPERRNVQVTQTVAKVSAGALAYIPVFQVTNLVRTLETLKEENFWVIGLAPNAREPIYKVDLNGKIVLLVGSEGKGMRRLVEETCDVLVNIPMLGKTESLNASVACGIALYEIARQQSLAKNQSKSDKQT
ncbi:MAG: 23S rRNA (guanosine(2251)-2'-O)-methyltransferase RlmB [Candidatus Melainabacteria bacterium]|nr:23S rRNA (guanosine(2251)-2'-O)-methyltransferase RlmB [Candidatus Melainabacteria bacterium]